LRQAKAVRALLDGVESTALNLGTGRGWSVRELGATARDVTGCDIPVQVGARRMALAVEKRHVREHRKTT